MYGPDWQVPQARTRADGQGHAAPPGRASPTRQAPCNRRATHPPGRDPQGPGEVLGAQPEGPLTMGVRVRAKPKASQIYWVFIAHAGRQRARRVGDRKAAELLKIRLQARLAEGDLSIFDEPTSVPSFEQVARRWLVEY